jgi:nitrate reductase (NAD(P)H)
MAIHSSDAMRQLIPFHIGRLEDKDPSREAAETQASDPTQDEQFLSKNKWKGAKLVSIKHINHDTCLYRFALDRPDQPLGLVRLLIQCSITKLIAMFNN